MPSARTFYTAILALGLTLQSVSAQQAWKGPDGVYGIGNGVSDPVPLTRVGLQPNDLARRLRVSGNIVLSFIVQEDGTVRDAQVVLPIGYGLDEDAVAAIQKWRFAPGRLNGTPVDVRFTERFSVSSPLEMDKWQAGPIVFDLPYGSRTPVLKSGDVPSTSHPGENETVTLQFGVTREGSVTDIRAIQGEASVSRPDLIQSLENWKFEPADGPVIGRMLFIKGHDQFRSFVSRAFIDARGLPRVEPSGAIALPLSQRENMDEESVIALGHLIVGGLFILPVVGILIAQACQKRPSLKPRLYKIAGILAAVSLLIAFSPLSLAGTLPDTFVFVAAYAVYCAIAFSLIFSRRWKLVLSGVIFSLPIALGYYSAATPAGGFAMGLVLGQTIPRNEISINSNYECRLVSFGYVTSFYAGYNIHVLYRSTLAPFVEWEIAEKQFGKQDYNTDSIRCLAPEDASNGTKVVMEARLLDGTIERTNVPR